MPDTPPGFFARLGLALRVLFNAELAVRLTAPVAPAPAQLAAPRSSTPDEPAAPASDPAEGALHLLAILQREGRLIDFLQEDVASFSDAEVGGAARVVHEGCRTSLAQYFSLQPLRSEEEGSLLTIEAGFDTGAIRLTGKVQGEPPYRGTLAHPGWRVTEVRLPQRSGGNDRRVIAPAEIEL